MDSSLVEGGLNVTLTIRLLMHGKVSVPPFRSASITYTALLVFDQWFLCCSKIVFVFCF